MGAGCSVYQRIAVVADPASIAVADWPPLMLGNSFVVAVEKPADYYWPQNCRNHCYPAAVHSTWKCLDKNKIYKESNKEQILFAQSILLQYSPGIDWDPYSCFDFGSDQRRIKDVVLVLIRIPE